MQIIPIRAKGPLLNRAAVIAGLTKAVRDTQSEGVRYMAEYPPAPPSQHYRRTGTLKRSWSGPPVQVSGGRITGEIGSNGGMAPYNEKVEGLAQDLFFTGRGWHNVKGLVALVSDQLPKRAQAELDRAAAQGGK